MTALPQPELPGMPDRPPAPTVRRYMWHVVLTVDTTESTKAVGDALHEVLAKRMGNALRQSEDGDRFVRITAMASELVHDVGDLAAYAAAEDVARGWPS